MDKNTMAIDANAACLLIVRMTMANPESRMESARRKENKDCSRSLHISSRFITMSLFVPLRNPFLCGPTPQPSIQCMQNWKRKQLKKKKKKGGKLW